MKKYIYGIAILCLASVFTACGGSDDDDIPPAIQPEQPDNPDPEKPSDDYNSLGEGWTAHKDGEPYTTYKGLVMCGYQGWFGTPGDGSDMTKNIHEGWYHYRESGMFRPGVLRNSIDFWPDMSEYTKKYTPGDEFTAKDGSKSTFNASPFFLPNGEKATLFSSYDESTVKLHFKWMKDYGIDGAFMQRFVGEVNGGAEHKDHFDVVLKHAMSASNEYGRAIAIMYDMSGITQESGMNFMVQDAQELMNLYNLTDPNRQKFYLHENGKPLLALWGVGFNDNDHPKPSFLKPFVDKLQAQGWAIMLGCPAYWRAGGNDCVSGTEHNVLINLIKQCDAFIPWYVGRYDYGNFSQNDWQNRIRQDIETAKSYSTESHKVVYAPHIYPGGSDRNMHPNNGYPDGDPTNTGYRYGGKFYWQQFYLDIKNGAEAIYVGMFDEIDEGTAIFKQMKVSDVPNNKAYKVNVIPTTPNYDWEYDYYVNYNKSGGYGTSENQATGDQIVWSTLASRLNIKFQGIDDTLPTDYYLWMTGVARKMLNGEVKMSEEIPAR